MCRALSVLQDACNSTGHFLPPVGERLGERTEPYSGNNGRRAKKFSAGASSLTEQLWRAALLCSVNALKKRMYVTYIRFFKNCRIAARNAPTGLHLYSAKMQ